MSYQSQLSSKIAVRIIFGLLVMIGFIALGSGESQSQRLPVETTGYDEKGEPYNSRYYPIKRATGELALLRDPELGGEHFILEITQTNSVTGCHNISDISYEAKFMDNRLTIEMGELTVDIRDAPQHPHYGCDQSLKTPSAQISLSKEILETNGTQYVRITDSATTNEYQINYTDDYVRMLPDDKDIAPAAFFKPRKLPGGRNSLTVWFYPEETLMLYTPSKPNQMGVKDSITKWAKSHNLEPLSEVFEGFEDPTRYMFFVDRTGYINEIENLETGAHIGEVYADDVRYTLEADVPVKVPVPLFAKRPGTFN